MIKWSVYFLDDSNSFIDFETKTNNYDPEAALEGFKEELNPSLTDYSDVSVKLDIAKPVDGGGFEETEDTIFLGEIDGRSVIIYRTDKYFEARVLLEEDKYFYIQARSAVDGMSDDALIENVKNFVSKCEFVSGAWTDL